MGDQPKWWEKLSGIGQGQGDEKRTRMPFRWLVVVALTGVVLMLITQFNVKKVDPIGTGRASPPETESTAKPVWGGSTKDQSYFRDYEQAYESQLRELLHKIVGVGDVDVMVTIESTEETVVEKNVKNTRQTTDEKDKAGATRQITDVTSDGQVALYQVSGGQSPLIVKHIKPKIRGVVVVARGAENPTVRQLLTEAVARGLDVTPNRVSVVPRKQ